IDNRKQHHNARTDGEHVCDACRTQGNKQRRCRFRTVGSGTQSIKTEDRNPCRSPNTLSARFVRCEGAAQKQIKYGHRPYKLLSLCSGVPYSSFLTICVAPPLRTVGRLKVARRRRPMNDKTILVVDDESQIRRVLRTTLSGNGYDVAEARNGEEAIQVMLQEHPHLILLDVNMPVMNGLDACRKIRLSYAGPVIMLTVRNAELDKVKALDAGADDYVVKPFSMEELLARIRAALRRAAHDEPLPRIETPELTIDL